ncbi:MAG: hypothetical protein LC799_18825 [Actinobacteria bacterium]|nr:hypothetical protein [Actinomycetota bacterium]
MDTHRNKFRVVGQWRAELDIKRFADAIIAFALHRMGTKSDPNLPDNAPVERDEELSP